jgi:hypothetical protein
MLPPSWLSGGSTCNGAMPGLSLVLSRDYTGTLNLEIVFSICMTEDVPTWSFLTNHARVLLCIAHDPGIRLRDIGDAVGITERAAHRIIGELDGAGYISRARNGRRNVYTIQSHLPVPDRLARSQNVGALLAVLAPEP